MSPVDKLNSEEDLTENCEKETQTSKTILQLACSDLSNTKPDYKEIMAQKINEDKAHRVTEIHPNISNSLEQILKHLNPHSAKSFRHHPGQLDQSIQVPALSRFTVKEIRIKAIQTCFNEADTEAPIYEEETHLPEIEQKPNHDYHPEMEQQPNYDHHQEMEQQPNYDHHQEMEQEPNYDHHQEMEQEPNYDHHQQEHGNDYVESLDGQTIEDNDHNEVYSDNSLTTILAPSASEFDRTSDEFHLMLAQIKSAEWDIALNALVEMARHSDTLEKHRIFMHMTEINQRLIAFLRSPRSHVCRTSCQVAGRLFETIKDTRRPEFDEIVELLLIRTADSNKFIRKDANVALDALILHMPPFHVVRAIGQKGPTHKNYLVRTAAARLFVCISGMADNDDMIFSSSANKFTRNRILTHMVHFIKDRNPQTREYGAALYETLSEHPNFEIYLREIVDKCNIDDIRKILKDRKMNIR